MFFFHFKVRKPQKIPKFRCILLISGQLLTTRIQKGPKGLGFTLIGNDGTNIHEEFIQVKFWEKILIIPDQNFWE